ncbi:MAG: RNA polymerase sigma factor [Muribaculaceae bacterium]|nr:RNA polymerase sigma factor [Muribaculaceae bacterium]
MDREQFIRLITRNLEDLRRLLTALCCGDRQLADDLAQDSLLKAYIQSDTLQNEEKFRPWLLRIAYTTFLNNKRAQRILDDYDALCAVAADNEADSAFRYQELYDALNRLGATERTAVALYYLEGYSIKEVASIVSTSPEAVKQHIYRGRQHLRKFLNP